MKSKESYFMETIITSLTIGLLATTSPCVLPLYPGFLAYISGGQDGLQGKSSRYFLGFFVLAGVLTMMLALGGIIALLSVSIGRALSFIIPIADAIIIILGSCFCSTLIRSKIAAGASPVFYRIHL
ncbi:cytochrome c biogenesis protein CcdA [Candidatus Villigracilis affinis]|uniref:cytochrome c biogenesis protein CcdA n=1 Tax=Candidatus Villigracilis affinis TaxID=3140682 RepID=UPI002A1ADC10|nr:hypothetical protein [Anaerolineales bacterium]